MHKCIKISILSSLSLLDQEQMSITFQIKSLFKTMTYL